MATIYDIAKLTGYSPSTVSKVFRGYSDVGEEARNKIMEAAKQTGYISKYRFFHETSVREGVIAVIYDDWRGLQNPFFSEVLNSVRDTLGEVGYDLLFIRRNPPEDLEELCVKRQVNGILLISTNQDFHITYRQLFQKFPIVSLNEVFVNEYSVLSNNAQGIRKAMEYLIRLGHKKIAMITGELNQKPGIERFKEYRECLSENGIRFSKKYVKNCTYYSYEEGHEIMKKLLEQVQPTAVLATGDYLCMGAIDYAVKAGYQVPRDISFVGFDDIEYARVFKPALTTVRQNKELLGKVAAELLLDLVSGKKPHKKRYLIDTELILRESSTNWKGTEL